MSQKPITIQLE